MKNIFILLLVTVFAFSCKNDTKKTETVTEAPKKEEKKEHTISGKTTDLLSLEDATAIAKKENKKVMLFYTGSDWCMPCKLLKKNILSTPEFKAFEKENFVEIMVDMPAKKKLPEAEVNRNNEILAKYKSNAVPNIIILDQDGNKMGEIKGYEAKWTTQEFIGKLKGIIS